MELSEFLAQELKKTSSRELANMIGISHTALRSMAQGELKVLPTIESLRKIAKAYKLPLWRVMEMAGVNLDLPDEPSYDAERLMLTAQQSNVLSQLLPKILDFDESRLYTILNYVKAPDHGQVYNIRIAIMDERYQRLIEELLELTPKLLPDLPQRSNIYEGKRIVEEEGRPARAVVTVNGQHLDELVGLQARFEWGYHGAGPRALSEAILGFEYSPEIRENYEALFHRTIAGSLPQGRDRVETIWMLESQQLDLWLMLAQLIRETKARGQ